MRIDDSNRLSYIQTGYSQRRSESVERTASTSDAHSADTSRAERLEKLKKMMSEGRSIDAGKLADKLLDSGIFFDERA
jgi:anti-sigma28 factor (negative regulator of flagellin synthesis)